MEYCELMKKELPNAKMHHPQGSTKMPKTTKKICARIRQNTKSVYYYSLPYRNSNCKVTQSMIDDSYEKIKTYYKYDYETSQLKENWKILQELLIKYNFNPIFVISLWFEESAAGRIKKKENQKL